MRSFVDIIIYILIIMSNIAVLIEAKKEYTIQLQKILTPRFYEGFKQIYSDSYNIALNEFNDNHNQTNSVLKTFQKMLKSIPQWNQELINKEYERIIKLSNCDYLTDLIEAIFISNAKILTSIQVNNDDDIVINVPSSTHFIHKCYIESAKEIYRNPYIFDDITIISPKEKHKNLRESTVLIEKGIANAIRNLLPIGDILKQGILKKNNTIHKYDKDDDISSISENSEDSNESDDSDDSDESHISDDNDDNIDDENQDVQEDDNIIKINNELGTTTIYNSSNANQLDQNNDNIVINNTDNISNITDNNFENIQIIDHNIIDTNGITINNIDSVKNINDTVDNLSNNIDVIDNLSNNISNIIDENIVNTNVLNNIEENNLIKQINLSSNNLDLNSTSEQNITINNTPFVDNKPIENKPVNIIPIDNKPKQPINISNNLSTLYPSKFNKDKIIKVIKKKKVPLRYGSDSSKNILIEDGSDYESDNFD